MKDSIAFWGRRWSGHSVLDARGFRAGGWWGGATLTFPVPDGLGPFLSRRAGEEIFSGFKFGDGSFAAWRRA
jgi:hypothetical protein